MSRRWELVGGRLSQVRRQSLTRLALRRSRRFNSCHPGRLSLGPLQSCELATLMHDDLGIFPATSRIAGAEYNE
jgi:hypothetical protein